MAGVIEAELKLSASDDAVLDALTAAESIGPARLGPARSFSETDVYLDTDDGRLAAERWACRLRTREGRSWISLKGPALHDRAATLHRRPEIEGPTGDPLRPESWPDSPARARVLELAGEAKLRERLALHQRRTERPARVGELEVATLSLDRVEASVAGVAVGSLRVVELELHDAQPDGAWVDEVTRALAAIPGLRPEPASKLELALELAAGEGAGR